MKLEEKVRKYLEKIRKEDKKINAFLYVNDKVVEEARELEKKIEKGKLYGYVFGVKSNINVKGMPISCASKSLESYYGSYDASVIEKIKKEDGLIIGITNCDEFAAGVSGEYSIFGATENPVVPGKIPGGSSSGSAAAVAASFCDVALGSDTGGSVRNPASHCGIIGMKPSYGAVSRYGLIDLSMSLDQIGVFAKNVKDATLVLDVIKGKDEKDTISLDFKDNEQKIGKFKVGIVRVNGVDSRIQQIVDKKINILKDKYKWELKDVEIKHIDLAVQTYYLIVYSEFFSATRRIDGRKYGKKIEENCGKEVLRRIFGGREITKAEFKGAYYLSALKVKEIIKEEFSEAFRRFDCLIFPTVPSLPWDIGKANEMKPEEVYAADTLTIPMNLAGICAVSVPAGEIIENSNNYSKNSQNSLMDNSEKPILINRIIHNKIPVGLQVVCNRGEDFKMLRIAERVEKLY